LVDKLEGFSSGIWIHDHDVGVVALFDVDFGVREHNRGLILHGRAVASDEFLRGGLEVLEVAITIFEPASQSDFRLLYGIPEIEGASRVGRHLYDFLRSLANHLVKENDCVWAVSSRVFRATNHVFCVVRANWILIVCANYLIFVVSVANLVVIAKRVS